VYSSAASRFLLHILLLTGVPSTAERHRNHDGDGAKQSRRQEGDEREARGSAKGPIGAPPAPPARFYPSRAVAHLARGPRRRYS
jgi:hypothetical protein